MEQIRKFLRDKGFALALLACLVAAAAAGVWAVRTVRDELDKNLSGLKTPDSTSTAPGIDEGLSTTTPQEDETTWEWPTEPAANSVSNVPKAASSASRSASSASSAPQAGSGSVREPSALQGASSPASSSAAPASTQPVSGRVLNGYSGDELVYNKTLGAGAPTTASTMPAQRMLPSKAPRRARWCWQVPMAAGAPLWQSRTVQAVSGGSAAWPARR